MLGLICELADIFFKYHQVNTCIEADLQTYMPMERRPEKADVHGLVLAVCLKLVRFPARALKFRLSAVFKLL